jgi:hypothetical protein
VPPGHLRPSVRWLSLRRAAVPTLPDEERAKCVRWHTPLTTGRRQSALALLTTPAADPRQSSFFSPNLASTPSFFREGLAVQTEGQARLLAATCRLAAANGSKRREPIRRGSYAVVVDRHTIWRRVVFDLSGWNLAVDE